MEQGAYYVEYSNFVCRKVSPLPLPSSIQKLFDDVDEKKDKDGEKSSQHGGRVRSFAHVGGNWATFVYIPGMMISSILVLFSLK